MSILCTYDDLDAAWVIARKAHAGQVDKSGCPYIGHPERVVAILYDWSFCLDYQVVGAMHDVLEDAPGQFGIDLVNSHPFPEVILDALSAMTRIKGEPWNLYIKRVNKNNIARAVKLADLKDNMDLTRIKSPLSDHEIGRTRKYHNAYLFLNGLTDRPS